jgi:hypothetical protein
VQLSLPSARPSLGAFCFPNFNFLLSFPPSADESMSLKTFNVENNFPSLDEARRMVLDEIRKSKLEGVRVLKIIHGYGSSGRGGTLHHGLRKSFALRKNEGVIKDFIPGEAFTIFNPIVLELLEVVPELRADPDLANTNEGVTVLWLK